MRYAQLWLTGTSVAMALLMSTASAAFGQTAPAVPTVPPRAQPTPPAEITPSHPAPQTRRRPNTMPAPVPRYTRPDTPGGTTSNGVARPPAGIDPGIVKKPPATTNFQTPVIPAPGSPGGNPSVVPK